MSFPQYPSYFIVSRWFIIDNAQFLNDKRIHLWNCTNFYQVIFVIALSLHSENADDDAKDAWGESKGTSMYSFHFFSFPFLSILFFFPSHLKSPTWKSRLFRAIVVTERRRRKWYIYTHIYIYICTHGRAAAYYLLYDGAPFSRRRSRRRLLLNACHNQTESFVMG